MSSSLYNNDTLNKDIKFINTHIGGNNDDDKKKFEEQNKLNEEISDSNKTFKIKTKNRDDGFNNYPSIINSVNNISNSLVVPEEYDSYIEYLEKKNLNNKNSRVITNFNYINIDSTQTISNINTNYINLQNNPFLINNNSNNLEIKLDTKYIDEFTIGDKITIQGIVPFTKNLSNINFNFTNGSSIVIVNLAYDFTQVSKFYDILITFDKITNGNLDYFENIPLNALNQTHKFFLINNNTQIAFNLPITFYSNNLTNLISSCKITLYSVGNIPIFIINASNPYSKLNLVSYQIISQITKNSIIIQLPIQLYSKSNYIEFGGNNVQIGKLTDLSNNSDFEFICNFNNRYTNIASIRMVSSELSTPNINSDNLFINDSNNKFYWTNLIDNNQQYEIIIPNGLYTYDTLLNKMTNLINSTPRISSDSSLYPYNIFMLTFDSRINLFSFKSYNKYILPKCFNNYSKIGNIYKIIIQQTNHLLTTLDEIEIKNSIDYYVISKNDINTTHKITNVISKDLYEITITNINEILDVGNTAGGNAINIITKNSFNLLFNYDNTVGNLLKFNYVGSTSSITPFCDVKNNYTINNNQVYLFNNVQNDILKDNLENPNYAYFLLLCDKLNHCYNPFSINYFYKFLLNNTNTSSVGVLYNTYVQSPIFYNPPLPLLEVLKLTFVNPQGDPINYKNFKYSFTLEIITISNETENTNININIAKL